MSSLPLPARIYVASVIGVGAALVAFLGPRATMEHPFLFALLLVLSALTSAFKVSLPLAKSGSTLSVSYAVDFAALITLGPNETMIVAVTSAWSQCTFRMKTRNPLYRTLFSLATHQPWYGVWNQNFLWSAPAYFVGAGAALLAKWMFVGSGMWWLALLLAAPIILTYKSYKIYMGRMEDERRHVQEMADLHLATIEALALAIDAKDQTAQSHIRRVQVYAAGLAKGLGMTDQEIQGVKTAALLHDIGKLAVPEHILSKPGPLTQEEFQKIRIHPQVGAEIIAGVPFPYPVAPLILSHHERWDGKGYPAGMKGDEIPAGARILAVVDYFDALTSERPYHKAMSSEA